MIVKRLYMNLILFGFKSCGKTFFGKKLAEKMGRPFIDTDDLLSSPPKELYRKVGESAFRALEKKAIHSLVAQNTIIAVGGGAVLDPENVFRLQRLGTLVYLKASFAFFEQRLLQNELPDPKISLFTLFHKRLPFYEAIPAHHIDLEKLDLAGVLEELQSILLLNGI